VPFHTSISTSRFALVFTDVARPVPYAILHRRCHLNKRKGASGSRRKKAGDFISSLMTPVTEPASFASWISPPKVGIDNKKPGILVCEDRDLKSEETSREWTRANRAKNHSLLLFARGASNAPAITPLFPRQYAHDHSRRRTASVVPTTYSPARDGGRSGSFHFLGAGRIAAAGTRFSCSIHPHGPRRPRGLHFGGERARRECMRRRYDP